MSALRLRLQDFALEAPASADGEPTYSQTQVDAIRRLAFAEGEAQGRAAAADAAAAALAEHAARLQGLAGEVADIRREAEDLLHLGLERMEEILRLMLDDAAAQPPGWEGVLCVLHEAAAAVRLPEIELKAAAETLAALDAAGPLPAGLCPRACAEIPAGEVHLAWPGGGGLARPDAGLEAALAAVEQALADREGNRGAGQGASSDTE